MSLVIIEDSSDVRYLLGAIVNRNRRYAILAEADNAKDGLAAVLQHRPDVVILDIGLPDRNGLHLLPELRAHAPAVRVVVLSGDHRPERNAEVIAAGAYAYIAKCDSTSRLVAVLDEVEPAPAWARGAATSA